MTVSDPLFSPSCSLLNPTRVTVLLFMEKRTLQGMPTQSRPAVRPSIAKIKSSKADTFETITELDGGLGEDNKTVYTTTWRLDYDGARVHFLKSKVDNG